MNKIIGMTKIALVGCALASVTSGCCLFDSGARCDRTCCKRQACPSTPAKTQGANASMTLSAGTDGISVGGESNLGSHGASASASTH